MICIGFACRALADLLRMAQACERFRVCNEAHGLISNVGNHSYSYMTNEKHLADLSSPTFRYFKTSLEIIRLAVMPTWQHWMIYAAPSFPCILQRKAQENVGECYPKE
jgi:hypothetical protein